MKFAINRVAFSKAIASMSKVVERRNTIPILNNVAIIAEKGSIELKATDLDLELQVRMEADVQVPGTLTVAAALLNDILRKGDSEFVSLEQVQSNIEVKLGRSKFKLHWLPYSDFPNLSVGEFPNQFAVNAGELRRIIKAVDFAISTEETRYYLNGIYLHAYQTDSGLKLRTVATDGHRLSLAQIDCPEGAEGMPGIIIPRKATGEILNLLPEEGMVEVRVSDSKIQIDLEGKILRSKLIDGTFPDYVRVIPQKSNTFAHVKVAPFAAAADRVSTVSSQRGRAVALTFAENNIQLRVNNPDSGSASDEVECEFDHPEIAIGFNAQYLQEAFKALNMEEVDFYLSDAGSPALITSRDDASRLVVLMPMRI